MRGLRTRQALSGGRAWSLPTLNVPCFIAGGLGHKNVV